MPQVIHLTRRAHAKAQEAAAQARAKDMACRAVLGLLQGHDALFQLRLAAECFDAVVAALADLETPAVTAPRLCAKAGQIYPFTINPRAQAKEQAERAMRKVVG